MMSKYKTVIGELSCVLPVPDYYLHLGGEDYLQVKFKDSAQAENTPLQTRIALAITVVPDEDDLYHVYPGPEYYTHVRT